MNLSRLAVCVSLLTVTGLTTPLAAHATNPTATVDLNDSYYLVTLPKPASTDDVHKAAQDYDLTVYSVQHNGPTNGELIVGDTRLGEALEMYRETDVQNFGTEPHVVSFVIDEPAAGLIVGGLEPESIAPQRTSSAAPESAATPPETTPETTPDATPDGSAEDTGEVTAANISKPWAPRTGTLRAYNSSTGAPRQIRHVMSWDSREGLNSYNTSTAEFVYEHDMKLYDRDPYVNAGGVRQVCGPDYWMNQGDDTRIVSSNVPSTAKVYADNARASDDCGTHDVSFGIFTPWRLSINTNYAVVVGGTAGSVSRSIFELQAWKLVRSCGLDIDWCVSLGGHPSEDKDLLINDARNWTVPGCFTWYREDSLLPVTGAC